MNESHTTDLTAARLLELKGLDAARLLACAVLSRTEGRSVPDLFAERFGSSVHARTIRDHFTKAAVAGGTGAPSNWGEALLPSELGRAIAVLADSFSVLGRLKALGVIRVPFATRVPAESTPMGTSSWIGLTGQGIAVIRGTLESSTLRPLVNAAIAVLTDELFRFGGSPTSMRYVRDALVRVVARGVDTSFCDPTQAAIDAVQPASVTHGAPTVSASGTTAAAAVADLQTLINLYTGTGGRLESAVFLLSSKNAVSLNLSDHRAFEGLRRDGGELGGCPALASESVGDRLILVDTSRILLADDEQAEIELARQATIEMLDSVTQHAGTPTASQSVSMFQTGSVAVRTKRVIDWQALDGAAAYISDASYLDGGSPS